MLGSPIAASKSKEQIEKQRARIGNVLSQVQELQLPKLSHIARHAVMSTSHTRNGGVLSRREQIFSRHKHAQAEIAETNRKKLHALLDTQKRGRSHARKLWWTLRNLIITTAVFKSMLPSDEKHKQSALLNQKEAQSHFSESSFAGNSDKDKQVKHALTRYEDYLTASIDTKALKELTNSPVFDQKLSYQTQKGIEAMQKSFIHNRLAEVDDTADKLCALTITNPLFDGMETTHHHTRQRRPSLVQQVSSVTKYWASIVRRSDPHRLVVKNCARGGNSMAARVSRALKTLRENKSLESSQRMPPIRHMRRRSTDFANTGSHRRNSLRSYQSLPAVTPKAGLAVDTRD